MILMMIENQNWKKNNETWDSKIENQSWKSENWENENWPSRSEGRLAAHVLQICFCKSFGSWINLSEGRILHLLSNIIIGQSSSFQPTILVSHIFCLFSDHQIETQIMKIIKFQWSKFDVCPSTPIEQENHLRMNGVRFTKPVVRGEDMVHGWNGKMVGV